jgi:hypothetical protein
MTAWHRIGILWLTVAAALTNVAQARDSRHKPAEDLIHAMKADEQAWQLVEKQILVLCQPKKCSREEQQCLFKIDADYFLDRLVSLAERELTPAEMEAGATYFRSEIGMKHREVMRAEQGLAKATLNDQAPDVRAAMLAFLDTSAGYRLVTRALLTNSVEVNKLITLRARITFYDCKPGK